MARAVTFFHYFSLCSNSDTGAKEFSLFSYYLFRKDSRIHTSLFYKKKNKEAKMPFSQNV